MRPISSRHRFAIPPAAGWLAVLLAGCTQAPKAETTPAAPVRWEPAHTVALEQWTELVGTTQPLPECVAHVTAPIDGRIDSLLEVAPGKFIHEGDEVTQGEVIAHLDDRIARFNLEKAKSAVETAKQDRAQAQTTLRLATEQVASLQNLKRQGVENGSKITLVSEPEMNRAKGAEETARSTLASTELKLDQANKDVDTAQKQLQLYTLTTPRKGRLGRVQVALGQTLALGAEIAVVVDLEDQIDVLSFVSQHVAAQLKVGQSAAMGGLDEKSGQEQTTDAPGRVVFIAPQAEADTGCFAVKVRFPNNEAHLRGNVVQRLRVLTLPGKDYLAIPEAALTEDQDPPTVEIVEGVNTEKDPDGKQQTGKVRRLIATVGIRDRVLHQVALLKLDDPEGKWKGKMEDALFITQNGQGLQTGDQVRLAEDEDQTDSPNHAPEK